VSDAPPDAGYRLALRSPEGVWSLVPATDRGADFTVRAKSARYQFAVLVFVPAADFVPDTVDRLADSGAQFAFVTPVLQVRPQ
jgi:hypothetical protein